MDNCCDEIDGSLSDSLSSPSWLDPGVDGSGVEVDDNEVDDEVGLNDGIGSSVSFDAGFGPGLTAETGTLVGAGDTVVVVDVSEVFDETGDCVVSAGVNDLLVSVLVTLDVDTVGMVEDSDVDIGAGVDIGTDADGSAAGVDGGVSGLIVNGGIDVDGFASDDDEINEVEDAGATREDDRVSDGDCVDNDSGFSTGRSTGDAGAPDGVDDGPADGIVG